MSPTVELLTTVRRSASEGRLVVRLLRLAVIGIAAVGSAAVLVPPSGAADAGAATSWQRRSLLGAGFEPGSYVINVAAGGPGLVAVGTRRDMRSPAVWSSRDGLHWASTGTVGLPRHAGSSPALVASSGDVTVIATFVNLGDPAGGFRTREWWSRDLRHWRVAHGAVAGATFNDVLGGPDGFVAVGSVGSAEDQAVAVIWFSRDGRVWHRATTPSVTGEAGAVGIDRVAHSPAGYVAVGKEFDAGNVVLWNSTDGRAWHEQRPGALPSAVVDIGAGPDGVIALTEPPSPLGGSLWFSSDGATWLPLPGYRTAYPSGSPDDVTEMRHTWVVAGSMPSARGNRTFGAWTSRDLETWSAMPAGLAGHDSSGPTTAEGVQLATVRNRVVVFSTGLNPRWFWTWTAPRPTTLESPLERYPEN